MLVHPVYLLLQWTVVYLGLKNKWRLSIKLSLKKRLSYFFSSEVLSAWLWGFSIAHFFARILCRFFNSGLVPFADELWCEELFLHKYVDLAGCGCGICWSEMVVRFIFLRADVVGRASSCSDLNWQIVCGCCNWSAAKSCNNNINNFSLLQF